MPAAINIEKVGKVPAVSRAVADVFVQLGAPACPEGRFKWVWPTGFNLTDSEMRAAIGLGKYINRTNRIVGIACADDTEGHTTASHVIPQFEKLGYTIVDPGFFPPSTLDFSSIIVMFREKNVEAVWANIPGGAPAVAFVRQCKTLGFNPKFLLITRGLDVVTPEDLGDELALGIIRQMFWSINWPFSKNEWLKEIWPKIAPGMEVLECVGTISIALDEALEAIKIAGNLDRVAIRDAFAKVDIMTAGGRMKPDTKNNVFVEYFCYAQFQKTPEGNWYLPMVWSPEESGITTVPAIFPKPW
jgi:ABC-type branched-subunit amino acid transport system substrate-binding protein